MSNIIEVNTSILAGDINKMQDLLSQIISSKDAVKDSIQTLDGMWKGVAHDTFMSAFADDYEMFNQLCETIRKLIECMDKAKNVYDNCESRVSSAIDSIRI